VGDGAAGAIERQQSGGIPSPDGMLGNEFLGEGVVEIGRPHSGI